MTPHSPTASTTITATVSEPTPIPKRPTFYVVLWYDHKTWQGYTQPSPDEKWATEFHQKHLGSVLVTIPSDPPPPLPQATEPSEKDLRLKYQDLVYKGCAALDAALGRSVRNGTCTLAENFIESIETLARQKRTACGVADELGRRLREVKSSDAPASPPSTEQKPYTYGWDCWHCGTTNPIDKNTCDCAMSTPSPVRKARPTPPPQPQGVRAFRRKDGKPFMSCDRLRINADGTLWHVNADGQADPADGYTVEMIEKYLATGVWIEVPDAPAVSSAPLSPTQPSGAREDGWLPEDMQPVLPRGMWAAVCIIERDRLWRREVEMRGEQIAMHEMEHDRLRKHADELRSEISALRAASKQ